MNVRISQHQLESYLWGAATLLRGTIDAGDYKQFIFPLIFIKRLCDVFDEEVNRDGRWRMTFHQSAIISKNSKA